MENNSPPIFFDTEYTINIKAPDDSILPDDDTLPADGFFVAFAVKDNTENYYYEPEEDDWIFHSSSHIRTKHLAFHARRDQLLAQVSARFLISRMLDRANIPMDAVLQSISKIEQATISIANNPAYAAPKIMPILVEIAAWTCRDISDYLHLFSDIEEEITADVSSLSIEENEPKATPASRSAIESLAKVKLDALNDQEIKVCTICFEGFLEDAQLISLPCKHVFHGECITKWLQNSNICPLCRFEMPVDPSE